MRIALLHNSSAGSEDHEEAELVALIEKAGHELVRVVASVTELTGLLGEGACDLVVVAGGDGTVGRTACRLAGWRVPIAILPLGTANNTAHALKLPLRPKKAVKSWKSGEKLAFDLGLVHDGVERVRFAECVGWGVFAQTIVEAKRNERAASVSQKLKRDRKLFRALVESAAPRFYRVDVDGRDCSGNYVLVEVLNIGLLGPQLMLSPTSDASDGQLELVLVGDGERAALARLAKSGQPEAGYRTERGRRIQIETDDALLHRDGRLARYPAGTRTFEFHVEAGAIDYLR